MIPIAAGALRSWLPRLAVVAGVLALGWWAHHSIDAAGYARADLEWQAKWDAEAARRSAETTKAEQAARAEEQRRQQAIDEVRADAQKEIDIAEADAAAAADAADGLREQARRLAARASQCPGNSGPAGTGQATSKAGLVLADVLRRSDERSGQLAAAYDRARAAGLACERAYDNLLQGGRH